MLTRPKDEHQEDFYRMSPDDQNTILRQRLMELQRHLPRAEYDNFLRDYMVSLRKTKDRLKVGQGMSVYVGKYNLVNLSQINDYLV